MTTLTIPHGTFKDGFVVLPRREYEQLLSFKKSNDFDIDIIEALEDFKKRRVVGPFSTLASGLKALKKPMK